MSRESDQTFVGREAEREALAHRIASHSLVTITGGPGVGKSALARQVIDGDAVVLDVSELRDASDLEQLLDPIEPTHALILLDGLDHLVGVADDSIAGLLESGATVLATTRERLRVPGERTLPLGPMTPRDAIALFELRAAESVAIEETHDVVAELVERLDRNPLAIEHAAARLRTFSPADLLERLDRRFALLRPMRGSGGASLHDAIEKSWELLDGHQRDCLEQCATFCGGFDLDAAEAVVRLDDDASWVLDVVEALVDKSLIRRDHETVSAPTGRLRMDASIRDFAAERRDRVASEKLERRHAEYFVGLGADWPGHNWTADELERAAANTDDLLAVIDRCGTTAPALAASAALSLDAVLRYRGLTDLHLRALGRGVDAARRTDDRETLARLLAARAQLGVVIGRLEQAATDADEAASAARALEAWETLIDAEVQHAEVERRTGHAEDALARLRALDDALEHADQASRRLLLAHRSACHAELGELSEARDIAMHIPPPATEGDPSVEYSALKRLAYAHYYLGSYEHQHRLNRDALELSERVGDRRRAARARQGLGDAAFARGDYEAVRTHYQAALGVHRELGNQHLEGVLLGNLGTAEHRMEAFEDAARHYEQSLAIHQQTGARPYEAVVTFALAVLEHERDHFDDAAFRYDRAAELFGDLHQPDDVVATQICRAWLEILRDDADAARRTLDWSEVSAPRPWLPVIEASRRLLAMRRGDEVEPMEATRDDESLPALLTAGLASLLRTNGESAGSADALTTSLQARLLLKFAATAPSPPSLSGDTDPAPRVVIGDGGAWFQRDDEEVVNLRRRRAHRLVLDRLMAIYEDDPGTPLDVYDAFDVGWPGESATAETAAERVYWVIGTLRKLGLDGVLLTSDAGYYLAPGADVARGNDQNV